MLDNWTAYMYDASTPATKEVAHPMKKSLKALAEKVKAKTFRNRETAIALFKAKKDIAAEIKRLSEEEAKLKKSLDELLVLQGLSTEVDELHNGEPIRFYDPHDLKNIYVREASFGGPRRTAEAWEIISVVSGPKVGSWRVVLNHGEDFGLRKEVEPMIVSTKREAVRVSKDWCANGTIPEDKDDPKEKAKTAKVCASCHQGRHSDAYHKTCPDERCHCHCRN